MCWKLSIWVAAALLALCKGQSSAYEENSLSMSGYHLCVHNETRTVSFLVTQNVPYTVTKPCGGWLLWETCSVTLYRTTHQTQYKTVVEQVTGCCNGYEQVGRYCALPVNRSVEFTAKPGSCPTAHGSCPGDEDCEWDMDCPGWQKCCQRLGRSQCSDPATSASYSENGGYRLNATVTVKTDYQQLMSSAGGHLNHIRLLQAVVTGALQSDVSVYYLSSWPVHPYRTATSLLIDCNFTLSLYNVTSRLHLLLKHIQEVSSVTVEDVDECAQPALRQCSPQAHCNNTEGSYHCACRRGYVDVDPSNPGAHCTAEPPPTYHPAMNTTYIPAFKSTQDPLGSSTTGIFDSTETSMTTALSNASSVPYNSSDAQQWTDSAPYSSMSSTVELPPPTTTCTPPSITGLQLANVTATSFCVYWSSQFQTNQTHQVVVSTRSNVICDVRTTQTMLDVRGLQPGVLYNVTVTPHACGGQGAALCTSVRTDAQTLDATARLTNIQFTDDLQNTSSQAYRNLSRSIKDEIYQALSAEMKALVDSGQVRIEITGFSPGSVVVNFTVTVTPSQSQDISNVSTALLHSLKNSTKYTVENTSINDFDECASGENDCSQWATCTNTWASYACACLDGFIDDKPERPGRVCQAVTGVTPAQTTTSATTTAPTTTMTVLTTTTTAPTTTMTVLTTTTTAPTTTMTVLTTTTTAPTTTMTAPTITTTAPTTTMTAPTTTTTAPTSPTTDPTTTIHASTRTITAPTLTMTATTTTTTAPTTTMTTPTITMTTPTTTTMTAPTTTTTTPTTTTTAPTTTMTAPTTTTTTPTITMTTPTTTTTAPTTTTTAPTTTNPAPTTTITPPARTMTVPTTTTAALTSTPTVTTTTNATAPPTNALRDDSMQGAVSVQCRVSAITVTVARDFLESNKIRESTLYLGLLGCGVNGGNATHVQLTVAWDECATTLVHNDSYYNAVVTLFNTMAPFTTPRGTVEAPRIRLEVPIMCTYMKSMLLSADFGSMGHDMIQDIIMGSGSFQVTVQLMNGTTPLPHNYSLSPEDAVVVEVSLNTSSEQIKVVITKCWATPTLSPLDPSTHIFLENSCSLNTYTEVLLNGNSSSSRVSVQIFSFVDLNVIYLHCQVQICVQLGSDTCAPDCLQRTARTSNTVGTAFGSSGPLLRSNDDSLEEEYTTLHIIGLACLGVGVSLFFIVGFVCLFYYQRNRIGHYNFSVKPKQENFTYLVFNT